MSLEHGEEHGEGGEGAHVDERPNGLKTPGAPHAGCRVRGDLPPPATELIAQTVIDAYEQAHYYGRAREYPLQAHHWTLREKKRERESS